MRAAGGLFVRQVSHQSGLFAKRDIKPRADKLKLHLQSNDDTAFGHPHWFWTCSWRMLSEKRAAVDWVMIVPLCGIHFIVERCDQISPKTTRTRRANL